MRATKSLALLVLALGCGLVASLGITQVMSRRDSGATAEMQPVLVAVKDITQGEIMGADLLKVEEWPKGKVPVGTLVRQEDAEGRRARARFFSGEPILEQKLFVRGEGTGPDGLIPKGFRVVSLKVDPVSIAGGLVMPGSRIDIQVYMTRNPALGIPETTTRTILQNIKVFAVNDVVNLDSQQGPETKSIQGRTVSLLVTPAQAEKITLAGEMGTIRLVMRSPEDDEPSHTSGETAAGLFGNVEAGRKDKETLLLPDPAGEKAEKPNKGFLEFLNSVRANIAGAKAGHPQPAKESVHWSMKVLKAGEVNEVDLEEAEQLSAADSGFTFWRVSGLKAAAEPPRPVPAELAATAKDEPRTTKDETKPGKEVARANDKKPSGDNRGVSAPAPAPAAAPKTN
jgi:pilus assembly protein CpaB